MESGLERTLVCSTVFTIEAAQALNRGQHGSFKCEALGKRGLCNVQIAERQNRDERDFCSDVDL